MRRPATLLIPLMLCVLAPLPAAPASGSANGIWQGTVQIRSDAYRIILHINPNSGTLDSPDIGKLAIPIASLRLDENKLSFEVLDPAISFQGTVSADQNSLAGDWKQDFATVRVIFTRLAQAPAFGADGSFLFHTKCTACHTPFNPARAPWPTTLRLMTQPTILGALEGGKMTSLASALSHDERVAIANYLGRPATSQQMTQANTCSAGAKPMANTSLWNGWGTDLSNTRFQPAELAGLTKPEISRLQLQWAFGYPGSTSAGGPPTIIGDRLFVAGGDGRIYSLNIRSACVYWTFSPSAPVRTAVSVSPDGRLAYFGDAQARAYAVDTVTGALLWKTEVDPHPFAMITGAPRFYDGKLYVVVSSAEELGGANPKYPCCSFRGSVSALDAKTGKLIWQTYTIDTPAKPTSINPAGTQMFGPSGAGVWTSPTIDPARHVLYVGTGDNYSDPATPTSDAVMALDLETGRIAWTKQLTVEDRFNDACILPDKSSCPKDPGGDFDIGAPPILRKLASGRSLLLVGQKSGVAYGLDPDDKGKIIWETRIGKGGVLGGIEFGGAASDTRVYFPLSDWTPDPKSGGGMFALDIATGKQLWSTPAPQPACLDKDGCSASQQAPATAIADAVFSGSLDGHIRAYDVLDGNILWDFDTAREFPTVNQVAAHGGSINYAGAVIVNGMVFVTSGYSINAGMPGNVLLVFTPGGK